MWGIPTEGCKSNFEIESWWKYSYLCRSFVFFFFFFLRSPWPYFPLFDDAEYKLLQTPFAGNLIFWHPAKTSIVKNFETQLMVGRKISVEWRLSNHKSSKNIRCYATQTFKFPTLWNGHSYSLIPRHRRFSLYKKWYRIF